MSPQNEYDELLEELGPVAPKAPANPYDAVLAEQMTREEATYKTAQQAARGTTPDRAAEAARLSRFTGLPLAVVDRNFDDLQRRVGPSLQRSYADLARQNPALTSWLSHPENAAVAQDDVPSLSATERLLHAATSVGRGVENLTAMAYAFEEATGELVGAPGLAAAGRAGRQRRERAVAATYGPQPEFLKIQGPWDLAQYVTEMVGAQLPITGASIAGSWAGGEIGSVAGPVGTALGAAIGAFLPTFVMGVGELQQNIKQVRPPGAGPDAPEPSAPWTTFIGGSAVAAFDTVLPGRIGSRLVATFGRETAEQIAERALTAAVKPKFLRLAAGEAVKDMATEGVTESIQEAIGAEATAQGTNTSVDWPALGRQMIEAGAGGAVVGGVFGGGHAMLDYRHQRAQFAAATEQAAIFTAIGEGLKDSKTVARMPEAAQAFIAAATKDGPLETVSVDEKTFTSYWQSKQIDPALIAQELTGNTTAYEDAQRSGVLEIPTAAYAVKIAPTEHNAFFAQELRFGSGKMNAREAAAYGPKLEQTMAAAMAAAQAEPIPPEATAAQQADPIYASLHTQLLAAGYPPTAAHANATLAARAYTWLGQHADVDTQAMFARKGWIIESAATLDDAAIRAREAARAAPATAATAPETAGTTASVPFMITRQMAADLRKAGHTDAAINQMTPAEAHAILALSSLARSPEEGVFSAETPDATETATPATGTGLSDVADQQPDAVSGGVVEGPGDGDRAERGGVSTAAAVPGAAGAESPYAPDDIFTRQPPEHTAARLTPEVTREVARLLDEMETFPFVERSWVWLGEGEQKTGTAAGGEADIVAGGAGAPVYDDILGLAPLNRVASGRRKGALAASTRGSRGAVIAAIRDLQATGEVKTNLAEGALRVAERRAAGDWKDLSHPSLPHADGPIAEVPLTDALSEAFDDSLAAGEGETAEEVPFDPAELEALAPDEAPAAGEEQPSLPGAEDVRETERAAPEFDAPFALTPEAAPVPGVQKPFTFEQGPAPALGTVRRFVQRVAPWLTEAERAKIIDRQAQRTVAIHDQLPAVMDFVHAAEAGQVKRFWYKQAARALQVLFGKREAPRFAALLAALSPQAPVRDDLENTLRVWTAWMALPRAERTTISRERLHELIRAALPPTQSGEPHKGLPAWIDNAHLALTARDPTTIQLSGPKVHSFFGNLIGHWHEVTNDSWMAAFAGLAGDIFGGTKKTATKVSGKTAVYYAYSAKVRQAAAILTERSGETWTPDEVQAAVWAWTWTLGDLTDATKLTPEQIVQIGLVTDADIAETPDFADLLLTDPAIRGMLDDSGYGPQLTALQTEFDATAGRTGPADQGPAAGGGSAAAPRRGGGTRGTADDARARVRSQLRSARRLGLNRAGAARTLYQGPVRAADATLEGDGPPDHPASGVDETVPGATGGVDGPVSRPAGLDDRARARDLQRDDVAGGYATRTALTSEHPHTLATATRIETPEDAASALSGLARGAQERFLGLVTDAAGTPLAVVGNFKGDVSASPVLVGTVLKETFRIKQAARVWFVHNHPSGQATLSREDRAMAAKLADLFRGSDIEMAGVLALGHEGAYEATSSGTDTATGAWRPPTDGPTVPVIEREQVTTQKLFATPLDTSNVVSVMQRLAGDTFGVLLTDTKLRPTGFLPLDPTEAQQLRTSGRLDALYRAISVANPGAVFINAPAGTMSAARNVQNALEAQSLPVVDIIARTHAGDAVSKQTRGELAPPTGVFYQAPTPTFYSRLTRAVELSQLAKATGAQWAATIRNAKIGINRDEFAFARVEDLAPGTVYTKADVLAYLSANTLTLEDVTLSEPEGPSREEIRERADEIFQQAVDDRRAQLEDNDDDDLPAIDATITFNEEEGGWEATVDGEDLGYVYDTEDEAQAATEERVDELRDHARDRQAEDREERARDDVDYDDAMREAEEELDAADPEERVHFAEYVEPGAVDGSYREVFLTAPPVPGPPIDEYPQIVLTRVGTDEYARGAYTATVNGEPWRDARGFGRDHTLYYALDYTDADRLAMARSAWVTAQQQQQQQGWEDGHDAYSDIQNPVVRLRFNERAVPGAPIARRRVIQPYQPFLDRGDDTTRYRVAVEGLSAHELRAKGEHRAVAVFDTLAEAEANLAAQPTYSEPTTLRTLFLEEVQPPHENQPMPALLRKHWREIGFKWALRHASEQGFDVLAWTSGAQQAARYSLEKQVDKIDWTPSTGVHASAGGTLVTIALKSRQHINFHVVDGVVQREGADAQAERWAGAPLEHVVGKEISAKIVGAYKGELAGEGLKIGGEGLKRLYDADFPAVVNKLPAVKQSGGRVGTVAFTTPGRPVAETRRAIGIEQAENDFWFLRLNDGTTVARDLTGQPFEHVADAQAYLNEWNKLTKVANDVPALVLTPALKAAVLGGQPLFQAAGPAAPRAAVTFTPTSFNINLFAGADPSSFMHEGAHIFLEVFGDVVDELRLRDPATLSASQQKVLADYTGALRWLGVGTRDQIGRDQHEQFARGFEAYLREGVAPSKDLRAIFAQFRTWLTGLYQTLNELNVVLTPEVRAIFDRMLASDAAIAEAQAEPAVQPMFTTAESAGMTPEAFAQYRDLVQTASDQAKAELSARLYRDWAREQRGVWTAAREQIRAEVTAEVQREPVYIARAAIRTGTHADGTPLVEGQPPTPIKVNMNPLLPLEEGEISLDEAAGIFGFTSGDALKQALATAPTQRRIIAAKTYQRLRAQFGDVALTRAVLREKADEVVSGAGRQLVVQAELKALTAGMQRGVIPPPALIRQHARARIRGTRVRDLRPGIFLVAAQRASQRAFDLKESDRAGAVQEKQLELVNLALYREAVQAKDTAARSAQWVRAHDTTAARARLGKAGPSFVEQWDGILDRFEFKRVTQKALDQRAALRDWVAAQEARGLPVDLPALLLEETTRTNYQNLTTDELATVLEGLKHLTHLARLENRLLTAKANQNFTTAVTTIEASLRANHAPRAQPLEFLPKDLKARKVEAWFASHTKLANFVRAMDGYQDGGAMWEYFMRAINRAADTEAGLNHQATVAIGKIMTRAYSGRDLAQFRKTLEIPAIRGSLSKEARLMVALNWGNEGNRQRLRDGRKWTDAQVAAILDTLDQRDWVFVQAVFDYLDDTYWAAIVAKQQRVTGLAPEKVEAAPIVTKFGTFRGGYFPVVTDQRLSARAGSFIDVETANLQKQAAYVRATTRRSHTEARAVKASEPIRLELSVLYGHVEQVIHDLSHHEMLIDVGRLLGDKRIQQAIYETHGDIVYGQLKNAIVDIAYGARPASNLMEATLNFIRGGTTVAGLAWNFWTVLQQPSGVFNGAVRVGPVWMLRGMKHMLRDAASMESSARWVYERSEMMRFRHTTQQREISELRNVLSHPGGWFDNAVRTVTFDRKRQQDITDSYFWLIAQAQTLADLPTWIGQYEKSMAAGETEDRAVDLANQAVLDSQSGGQIKDLAEAQRGNVVFKLFTNFYSYGNLLYNQTQEAYGRTNFHRAGSVGQFAGNLTLLYVFPALVSVMLAKAFGRDDDEEGILMALGREMIGQALNTMVLLRELGGLARLGGGNRGYEGPTGTRAIGAVTDVLIQAKQGELDRGLLRATEDTAGILFRLPLPQVQRSVDGFVALQDGQTQNPLAILTGPPRKK